MREIPIAATGVLLDFCRAGMLTHIDFHLARRLAQLSGEGDPQAQLAFALAARELRLGSVCLDLATASEQLHPEAELDDGAATGPEEPLPWPEPKAWLSTVRSSPAVAGPDEQPRPFRLEGTLLYLDRYWRQERQLGASLRARSALAPLAEHDSAPPPPPGIDSDEHQDQAVLAALNLPTVVITGGPGTGKTTIVARILTALSDAEPRVALAAPTGRAAGRLQSAVAQAMPRKVALRSSTLHKLLGARPRSSHVEYGPNNPLPFDVIVVDETSMVSLEMMGQLLAAVAPTTRLILLGDPHQLRSVEAGAVLADIERADLVTAPGGALVRLEHNYRSDPEIDALARAILAGDSASALAALERSGALSLVDFDGTANPMSLSSLEAHVTPQATRVRLLALGGQGAEANRALDGHRILCGHREGPFGVSHWGRSVRTALAATLDDYGHELRAYLGQPLLIQRNSDLFSNGDTGVVCVRDGQLRAAIDVPGEIRWLDPHLLDDATDLHAMTIHKSQGSQFDAVSVVLPPLGSPLLTRELLYTAVTRARHTVTLYGSRDSFIQAVETPVRRASGL